MTDLPDLTPEQEEVIVNATLDHFTTWLNKFNAKNDPGIDHTYTPEEFTGGWGHTDWKVLKHPRGMYDFGYIEISTTDGDEGGGSTLLIAFYPDWELVSPKHRMRFTGNFQFKFIVHTFDTSSMTIWTDEGKYLIP